MSSRILILLFFSLGSAYPAESGITGSILGYLFDPATGVQPILGIPGAATIGQPLILQTAISRVSLSLWQSYALAIAPEDSNLLLIRLADPASVAPLAIPIAGSGLIAFSPSGSTAAIHDRDRNRILVVSGLPEGATLANEIDLSSFSGTIESIALNDSAASVLLGFSDSVVAIGADGHIAPVELVGHAGGMTFLYNSSDAIVADTSSSKVYLLRNVTGATDASVLLGDFPEAAAVAVSKDNKRAFVASSLTGSISEIELSSGSVTSASCPCRPSTLAPLNGNAVFRLTEPNGSAVWLLDGDSQQSRTFFVPPFRPQTTEEPVQ